MTNLPYLELAESGVISLLHALLLNTIIHNIASYPVLVCSIADSARLFPQLPINRSQVRLWLSTNRQNCESQNFKNKGHICFLKRRIGEVCVPTTCLGCLLQGTRFAPRKWWCFIHSTLHWLDLTTSMYVSRNIFYTRGPIKKHISWSIRCTWIHVDAQEHRKRFPWTNIFFQTIVSLSSIMVGRVSGENLSKDSLR